METRVFQNRQIATILRIQAHKLNDMERATFSNIDEQNIEFMQDTMAPWFARFEGEGNRQLLPGAREHFIAFLLIGYLRGSPEKRAQALQIRRQNGTLNADEWREIEDENPLPEGQGKAFWMPVNMQPVGPPDAGDEPAIDEQPPRLTAVKSAATINCPDCGHMLGKATPPFELRCRWCKKPVIQTA